MVTHRLFVVEPCGCPGRDTVTRKRVQKASKADPLATEGFEEIEMINTMSSR